MILKRLLLFSETICSLIDGLSEKERAEALLIVMVAEPNDVEYVKRVYVEVKQSFADHFDSGLLEIISPHPAFYPNLENIKVKFGLLQFLEMLTTVKPRLSAPRIKGNLS